VAIKPTDIKPLSDEEKAKLKVKAAENAWNMRNPELVDQAYTPDSKWRNSTEFFTGREAKAGVFSGEPVSCLLIILII
jgi:nuclear transport factor 2 (NTF2) superfamily protein